MDSQQEKNIEENNQEHIKHSHEQEQHKHDNIKEHGNVDQKQEGHQINKVDAVEIKEQVIENVIEAFQSIPSNVGEIKIESPNKQVNQHEHDNSHKVEQHHKVETHQVEDESTHKHQAHDDKETPEQHQQVQIEQNIHHHEEQFEQSVFEHIQPQQQHQNQQEAIQQQEHKIEKVEQPLSAQKHEEKEKTHQQQPIQVENHDEKQHHEEKQHQEQKPEKAQQPHQAEKQEEKQHKPETTGQPVQVEKHDGEKEKAHQQQPSQVERHDENQHSGHKPVEQPVSVEKHEEKAHPKESKVQAEHPVQIEKHEEKPHIQQPIQVEKHDEKEDKTHELIKQQPTQVEKHEEKKQDQEKQVKQSVQLEKQEQKVHAEDPTVKTTQPIQQQKEVHSENKQLQQPLIQEQHKDHHQEKPAKEEQIFVESAYEHVPAQQPHPTQQKEGEQKVEHIEHQDQHQVKQPEIQPEVKQVHVQPPLPLHSENQEQFVESVYEQVVHDAPAHHPIQPELNEHQKQSHSEVVFIDSAHEQIIVDTQVHKEEHQIGDLPQHSQLHLIQEIHKETQNIQQVTDSFHIVPPQPPSPEPEIIMPTLESNATKQHRVEEEEEKQVEQNEEGRIYDETEISQKSEPKVPPPKIEIDQKSQLVVQFQKSLDEATFLKNQGNLQFQQKNYQKAIEQYNLAVGLCDPSYLMQCPDEQLVSFKKLRITLLSNLSACYLNIGDSNTCITHANLVIQLDSQNMKAWYRRAMAYQQKQDYEEAYRDIDQAWNLVKNTTQDIEIFEKRKEIRSLLKESNKESQVLYKTMFNSAANPTEKTAQTKTTDSKLTTSEVTKPFEQTTETQGNFILTDFIWKATASALLASSMTRFILEDKLDSKMGIVETLVLGSTTASAMIFPKNWQKFSFATITAGFLAFVLYRKQTK